MFVWQTGNSYLCLRTGLKANYTINPPLSNDHISYVSLFLEVRYSVVIVHFRGMVFDLFKDIFTEQY